MKVNETHGCMLASHLAFCLLVVSSPAVMFEKVVVIDARAHLLGRLASVVAKQLLNGTLHVLDHAGRSSSRRPGGELAVCRAETYPFVSLGLALLLFF